MQAVVKSHLQASPARKVHLYSQIIRRASLFALVCAANLLLVDFKGIAILHIQRFRTIRRLDATTIEEETNRVRSLALPLTESIHELLQGCGALDLEENLIVVICNFDVEMFAGTFCLFGHARASISIRPRHLGDKDKSSGVFLSEIACARD